MNRERQRIAVIFGGRSGEHEVSLMSARSVVSVLDPETYHVVPIGITVEGNWLVGDDPVSLMEEVSTREEEPVQQSDLLQSLAAGVAALAEVDVVFPVLHGPYGEDGTIQGLFEMAGVPYVGAGVVASAVAMDKALSKRVFEVAGLPLVPYVTLMRAEWEQASASALDRVEAKLSYPMFVKPANLGSSVGVSKVHTRQALEDALHLAAQYDRKLIVEVAIEDAREIEVSVLGNEAPIASIAGEVRPGEEYEYYDYEAKYTEGASELLIPAPVDDERMQTARRLAVKAFQAVDGSGLARVDFLLDPATDTIYLNEVNTMPGFTVTSMYPKLWEATGIPYPELVERLIALGLKRHAEKKRNRIRR